MGQFLTRPRLSRSSANAGEQEVHTGSHKATAVRGVTTADAAHRGTGEVVVNGSPSGSWEAMSS